jgi:RNA polymerase primary sigma factor
MTCTAMRNKSTTLNQFDNYFRDVGDRALLTAEEETFLGQRVQEGDPEAREEMIRANLRLVVKIAKQSMGRGGDFGDMISDGNLGLMHAVEYFDPNLAIRFATYAKFWIKESINRGLRNTSRTIHIPTYMHQLVSTWNRASDALENELGRLPSREEIGERLGLSQNKIKHIAEAIRIHNASPKPEGDEMKTSLADLAVDKRESNATGLEVGEEVERVLSLVDQMTDERAKMVLRMRFGLGGKKPMTLQQVGEVVGITRERVRQIEFTALAELRRLLGDA